jgi:hypothetical protein
MLFLILLLIIALIFLFLSLSKEKNKNSTLEKELENKKNELEKYYPIINAEEKAKEIIDNAEEKAGNIIKSATAHYDSTVNQSATIKTDAIKHLDTAKEESYKILNDAKKLAESEISIANEIKKKIKEDEKDAKIKYDEILSQATIQAKIIIDSAESNAKNIAGNAYLAMKNSEHYENTAKAMKNIIDGYGDKYLIPTFTLLDQLAEDFGFTEAGNELKKARERTRLMVNNKTAAKCDYVEDNRKETAINFITDAFNGKVDTILSGMKHDNFGTLEQKIDDAYFVVNNLGKAFRNALITEEYLQARKVELKWGVIATELKLKEREEQRLIKEQIKEEEKARKEFEKAIKDAEKEEEMLKKAMEKIQKELQNASEQQKLKYEEQLTELNQKLKDAEEKNQRAISMAQQTKSGHVYIISNIGSFGENVFKIGMTRRLEPLDRVKELGDASVPFSFDVHALIYSEDAPTLEHHLHKHFIQAQVNKVNPRKEFFKLDLQTIKNEIEKRNINVQWTMLSEASEYRESLAIEKSLLESTTLREEWVKHQLELEKIEIEET